MNTNLTYKFQLLMKLANIDFVLVTFFEISPEFNEEKMYEQVAKSNQWLLDKDSS